MPTLTTEVSIVLNAHRVPPRQKWRLKINKRIADEIKEAERNVRKKCKKEMQERKQKTYIQQGRIEITLKEYPGRANLPVPHYSPDGQSAREMTLSVGH